MNLIVFIFSLALCTILCFIPEQILDIFVTALNQGLIQFELKSDIRIVVYMTQQTLGKFVCNNCLSYPYTCSNVIAAFKTILDVQCIKMHKRQC